MSCAPYAQWTWTSAQSWRQLNAEMQEITGEDMGYRRPGGVEICIDAEELESTRDELSRLRSHAPHFEYQMLDRNALSELLPGLGPDVAGGSYSPADGHVNPLYLLRGLHQCISAKGGRIETGNPVIGIRHSESADSPFRWRIDGLSYQRCEFLMRLGCVIKGR